MLLLAVAAVALLFIAWVVGEPWLCERRRAPLRGARFAAEWRAILRRRMPLYRRLPHDLQRQLKERIQVFVAETNFIGCAGQEITDDIRVTIAAQASLLRLNRRDGHFPNLRQVLVYPGAFVVDCIRTDGAGVLREQRQVLSGESWTQGQVVLSWDDVVAGAAVPDDGRNVVIHEFAHQLDQEKGHANGAPGLTGLPSRSARRRSPSGRPVGLTRRDAYRSWSAAMRAGYAALQADALRQRPSLLSHYGATDPAEFFAVASEVFFEQAQAMADTHPDLYRELAAFYRVDPASW